MPLASGEIEPRPFDVSIGVETNLGGIRWPPWRMFEWRSMWMSINAKWFAIGQRCPRCGTRLNLLDFVVDWRFCCHSCWLELKYSTLSVVISAGLFLAMFVFLFVANFGGYEKKIVVICFFVFVVLAVVLPIEENKHVRSPRWPKD